MTGVTTTILTIIDAAGPPPDPATLEAESENRATPSRARSAHKDKRSDGEAGRHSVSSTSEDGAPLPPGARPPAAAAHLPPNEERPSQTGASEALQNEDGVWGGALPETLGEIDLRLAWFPRTDLGNAERFVERHRGLLMYCEALDWLWWDGRRWAREGALQRVKRAEHDTVRAIQREAKALAESGRDILIETKRDGTPVMLSDKLAGWGRASEANSKIVSIEKNGRAYLSVNTEVLDADRLAINVLNGTLIVRRTWTNGSAELAPGWRRYSDHVRLKPHDPKDLITKLAEVAFDPDAEREQFDRFLSEVQPALAMRRFLQQWKGYSLTGDTGEHCMALFLGKGRNGKSVFEDATAHVAGDYAETVPIETFLASGRESNANAPTPARALLHNARMVRTSEPNKGASLDEGFIKLVTGGEPIQARNLNLPMFRFYPALKLTVSGNHRPKIGGTDEGIWSRIKHVPWDVTIPAEKRDRALTEKLRGEASGILNWMLDGVSDWIEHGLVFPEDVVRATAEYRRDSDQLGRFLEVCVIADTEGRVQSSVLHSVFNAWARANGGAEWSNKGLTNAMRERGYKSDKSSVMFWTGIKLTKTEGDFGETSGGRMNAPNSPSHASVEDGHRTDGEELAF